MLRIAVLMAALAAGAPAMAQDEAAEEALGVPGAGIDAFAEVNLLSDYRFRGVSRSDEDPAAQVALTLSHGSGFYLGGRGTSLNGIDGLQGRDLGDVELDLYAGYGAQLGGGFEVDAGAVYYVFTGGDGPTDYVEPYASLSYLIGPVYATAGAKYAPSQRAIGGEDMLYLFGQVDVSIPFRPWSFSALVGRQEAGAFQDYWTWSLGVEHQLQIEGIPDTELGLRYVDTDLPGGRNAGATLVASIGLSF